MTVAGPPKVALSIEAAPARLDPRFPLARRELLELVALILDALELSGAQLSLTVVDDAAQAALNVEFLACLGPTNILSFPEGDPSRPRDLGALFLSAETLAREAFLYGQDPRQHTARLLAHGILHLAGFDHGPEMDELTERAVARACPAQS